MQIVRTAKLERNKKEVSVWHCQGCALVHISVGRMMLNFTQDEFARFTDAVVEINTAGLGRAAACSILELAMVGYDDAGNETVH